MEPLFEDIKQDTPLIRTNNLVTKTIILVKINLFNKYTSLLRESFPYRASLEENPREKTRKRSAGHLHLSPIL